MNNYTIQKIENDIILTLPTTATYHNKYRNIYYLNNSKGIQIKRKYQPLATAHLESIKIEAENITSATSDDITFQFRTMTGGVVSVKCGENTSELVTNVTSQLTPQDFYLDAVGGIGNNLHIADFINTVLIDVFSNSSVLDELCADEEVVTNPCPKTECPECPEQESWTEGMDELFNELLETEWIDKFSIETYQSAGVDTFSPYFEAYENKGVSSISVVYNNETYIETKKNGEYINVEVPIVEGVTEAEITMIHESNTKILEVTISPYYTKVTFDLGSARENDSEE